MDRLPIICIDFDGVLHSYVSGWCGPRTIPDHPVPGAIDWLRSLLGTPDPSGLGWIHKGVQVCIYSSRSRYIFAKRAMKKWLLKNGLEPEYLERIKFPTRKPPAHLTIDDRAVCFCGVFPKLEDMKAFVPWYKAKKE